MAACPWPFRFEFGQRHLKSKTFLSALCFPLIPCGRDVLLASNAIEQRDLTVETEVVHIAKHAIIGAVSGRQQLDFSCCRPDLDKTGRMDPSVRPSSEGRSIVQEYGDTAVVDALDLHIARTSRRRTDRATASLLLSLREKQKGEDCPGMEFPFTLVVRSEQCPPGVCCVI
jgi:hypothetical protein